MQFLLICERIHSPTLNTESVPAQIKCGNYIVIINLITEVETGLHHFAKHYI